MRDVREAVRKANKKGEREAVDDKWNREKKEGGAALT